MDDFFFFFFSIFFLGKVTWSYHLLFQLVRMVCPGYREEKRRLKIDRSNTLNFSEERPREAPSPKELQIGDRLPVFLHAPTSLD